MCAARALPIIQLLSTHHQETIILRSAALCPARWQLLSITVGVGHLASSWPKHVTSQGPRAREAACHHVRSPYLQLSSSGSRLVSSCPHTGACAWGGEQAGTGWLLSLRESESETSSSQQPAAAPHHPNLHFPPRKDRTAEQATMGS